MSPQIGVENGRKHLATAGQRVFIGRDGAKDIEQFAEPADVQVAFRDGQWNEVTIIARGPRLVQNINGVVLADLADEQITFASQSGVIALQDHGKGAIVAFKDIRIKHFDSEENE